MSLSIPNHSPCPQGTAHRPLWGLVLVALLWVSGSLLGASCLGAAPAIATSLYEMPLTAPEQPILDIGNTLSRLTTGKINNDLTQLAQNTGSDVHFVTIHRLDYGETTDSFTEQLFEQWFPTPEAQANQTLLVFDTLTNTSAIRTGAGDRLPADTATSVAQETLLVPIRAGNYNEAFSEAKDRLVAVLSGQTDPGPPVVESTISTASTFKKAEETDQGSATVVVVVLLILATVIPMVTYFAYQGFS
jgi:uncharacterized protein